MLAAEILPRVLSVICLVSLDWFLTKYLMETESCLTVEQEKLENYNFSGSSGLAFFSLLSKSLRCLRMC